MIREFSPFGSVLREEFRRGSQATLVYGAAYGAAGVGFPAPTVIAEIGGTGLRRLRIRINSRLIDVRWTPRASAMAALPLLCRWLAIHRPLPSTCRAMQTRKSHS
ncbi:MAG: hypothetical protein WCK05_02315 [Planctomycetota bacterium]